VLAFYHMANPGTTSSTCRRTNVLAPKRQQELGELASVLAKFKPAKIAVENDSRQAERPLREVSGGQYALTTNEIDQIGLRLAKNLGHTTIYAVDADGDFRFARQQLRQGHRQSAKLDEIMTEVGGRW